MNDHIAKPVRADELSDVPAGWLPADRVSLDPGMLGELLELAADAPGLRDLAVGFAERTGARLSEVRAALDAGDRDTAMRICHSIRGSAGAMAAVQVTRLSGECEQAISRGDLDRADAALRELHEELPRVQDALDRAFAGAPEPHDDASDGGQR